MKIHGYLGAVLAAFFLSGGPTVAGSVDAKAKSSEAGSGTLVLARISNNPRKQIPRMEKLAEYLLGKLGDLGIRQIKSITLPDRETMAAYLRDGKADFYSETVLTALYLEQRGNGQIVLREWKKGVASYRSVVVASVDSGINDLNGLRGRKIAFEDASSTSGFLVPFGALLRLDLGPTKLNSPRSATADGTVGYVFAEEELNIAGWVVRGVVAAGAMSDKDFADASRVPAPIRKKLRVIYKSDALPRSLFSIRRTLAPKIKARIQAVLLKIHKDPDAKPVLKKYYKIKKFDEVIQLDYARQIQASLTAKGF